MRAGIDPANRTALSGSNPCWRLALTREWGLHNLMVGTSDMTARVFDTGSDVSDPGALMKIVAHDLTTENMTDVAAYLQALPTP